MHIRQATQDDAELLAHLGRQTFCDAFADSSKPADMEQYLAETFTAANTFAALSMPTSVFLLAYETAAAHQPLGYAYLKGNALTPAVSGQKVVELARLYLVRDAVGKGYGAQMMQNCLAYAAKAEFDTIWLGVWEHNQRALHFYERWGFRQVGTQPFPLGQDLQTDWIMARSVVSTPAS